MTKDEALRLAEEAIMDELEAVTAEEFEDAAGKLDDALHAIWKVLVDTVDTTEKCVDETVECGHEPVGSSKMEPTSEPVAWKAGNVIELKKPQFENGWTPLYAAPQPRHDVDLTDDEIGELIMPVKPIMEFARAVIAAYKEKNK